MTDQEIKDERLGLHSASNMQRSDQCPGWWRLAEQVDAVKEPLAFTQSCIKVHEALGKGSKDGLTDEECDVFDQCEFHWANLVREVFVPGVDQIQVINETRIWMRKGDWIGAPLYSGKPDRIAIAEGAPILVADWKLGYKQVPPAACNWQLLTLAVLAREQYPDRGALVAIIQPNCTRPVTSTMYDDDQLRSAKGEIESIIQRTKDPFAKLKTGDHCQYCPAETICPERKGEFLQMQKATVDFPAPALLSGDELSSLLGACDRVDDFITALKEEARLRITDGTPVPGYALAPGKILRPITNTPEVYRRTVEAGVPPEKLAEACKILKGEHKRVLREATGMKGEALSLLQEKILDGCTAMKECRPQLVQCADEPLEAEEA